MLNRQYKSSLFIDVFSRAENGLSIYNALLGTDYKDISDLEIVTLKDAIFMKKKDDVALLIQMELLMLEHQSTMNPNMPIRGLQYYGNSVDGYIKRHKLDIYGKKLIKIPTPHYFVLYNGSEEAPDKQELKLSDAFEHKVEGYEWTAVFLNINSGHNQTLMQRCPELEGYAKLISYIRENSKNGMEQESAVDEAVNRCIKEGYLEKYLSQHIGEAKGMLLSGFDEEIYENGLREEGRAEGREEGREEGQTLLSQAIKLIRKGMSDDEILKRGIDAASLSIAKDCLK